MKLFEVPKHKHLYKCVDFRQGVYTYKCVRCGKLKHKQEKLFIKL